MKIIGMLILFFSLGACALTPTERSAIGQGVSALAVSAIDQLSEIGQNPVAVSQQTHNLMAFGCGIVEEGGPLLGVLIDIALARQTDGATVTDSEPVTGAEILGYVQGGCAILWSLPIKPEPDVAA